MPDLSDDQFTKLVYLSVLLVLLVGRATRLAPYVAGEPKVYDATVRFGLETTTDDATGEPLREAPLPERGRVLAAYGLDDGRLRWEVDLAEDVDHLFVADGRLLGVADGGLVAFG